MKRHRPWSVTCFTLGVLTLATVNLLRWTQTLRQWSLLQELLPISPVYHLATGLLWMAAGLPLAWGLWKGRPWAPLWSRLATVAYLLYYWVDRLLIADPSTPPVNLPFAIGMSALTLLFVWWFFTLRPVKAYYQ